MQYYDVYCTVYLLVVPFIEKYGRCRGWPNVYKNIYLVREKEKFKNKTGKKERRVKERL